MLSSNVPPEILTVLYTFVVSFTLFDVDVVWAKGKSVLAPTFFRYSKSRFTHYNIW
jgi:hypothetical protein